MPEAQFSTAQGRHMGAYAALSVGRLYVLVPRTDVRTIEAAADVDREAPPPSGAGWIELNEQRLPVYCTGPDLHPVDSIPAARRICLVLRSDSASYGLLCDELALTQAGAVDVHELPTAMRMPRTPVIGLAKYADSIACVCTAERLLRHLTHTTPPGGASDAQHGERA